MVHQGLAWHVPARPCAFSGEVRRGRAPTHHLAPTRVPCAPSTRCAPRYRPASTLAISPARCSCGHCSCVTPRHHPSRPPSRRACRPSRAATPPRAALIPRPARAALIPRDPSRRALKPVLTSRPSVFASRAALASRPFASPPCVCPAPSSSRAVPPPRTKIRLHPPEK